MDGECSAEEVCTRLREALALRCKYVEPLPCQLLPDGAEPACAFEEDGLFHVRDPNDGRNLIEVPALAEYYQDMNTLFQIRSAGPVSTYCFQRLQLLQTRFELYSMVTHDAEVQEAMSVGHRDFYNVRKVDTHVHHSAAMNAKHLLRFMKKKLKSSSDDVVDIGKDGTERTLGATFEAMGITWKDLSLDRLQVWADRSCLHRFDRFNNKYSPMGHNDLRTIFLKTDNAMGGRYLAEITRELIDDLEESKYQHTEWRLSIYGRKNSEWENLARWVLGKGKGLGDGRTLLSPNVRWMIQIPRLFALYRSSGLLNNFGEMLENIFGPIFQASLNPEAHPHVARFLQHISGFDTVDDESKSQPHRAFSSRERTPAEWDLADNPSYKYYSYFIQANLRVLNGLRAAKGLNTFSYRPHAGEAGEVHHLDTAWLLADGINHGLNLRKTPALQYLFYLGQVGVAMSPCSNNQLFLAYEKSPFPVYFARGLNVSLSTDDPLMFHQTKEPLMEEYSIAKQLWHLSSVDLCEIARNSVLQSGFPVEDKAAWLGSQEFEENRIYSTNLPDVRTDFRKQSHREEMRMVRGEVSHASMERNVSKLLGRSSQASPSPPCSPKVGRARRSFTCNPAIRQEVEDLNAQGSADLEEDAVSPIGTSPPRHIGAGVSPPVGASARDLAAEMFLLPPSQADGGAVGTRVSTVPAVSTMQMADGSLRQVAVVPAAIVGACCGLSAAWGLALVRLAVDRFNAHPAQRRLAVLRRLAAAAAAFLLAAAIGRRRRLSKSTPKGVLMAPLDGGRGLDTNGSGGGGGASPRGEPASSEPQSASLAMRRRNAPLECNAKSFRSRGLGGD